MPQVGMNWSLKDVKLQVAQTRQKGVILQHGSLLQDVDVDELFDMFILRTTLERKMKKAFVDKAVAINDISDRHISIEEMEKHLKKDLKRFKYRI